MGAHYRTQVSFRSTLCSELLTLSAPSGFVVSSAVGACLFVCLFVDRDAPCILCWLSAGIKETLLLGHFLDDTSVIIKALPNRGDRQIIKLH